MDIDEILNERRNDLGRDFVAYRNHVHRVAAYCFALHDANEDERAKIVIAACFHDLGIWTHRTFDYLAPSVELAQVYLREHGLERWSGEIEEMIAMHHKIRVHRDPLVEAFRKSDLADVSWGLVRPGLSRADVRRAQLEFPNAGFHKFLVKLAGGWCLRHPLHPLPILKW